MNRDELIEKLRKGHHSWGTLREVDLANLPTLKQQRELIEKLGKVLEGVLEADMQKLEDEREKLDRLHRGGGK